MIVPFVPPWKATSSPFASESAAFESTVVQMGSWVVSPEVRRAWGLLVTVAGCADVGAVGCDAMRNSSANAVVEFVAQIPFAFQVVYNLCSGLLVSYRYIWQSTLSITYGHTG